MVPLLACDSHSFKEDSCGFSRDTSVAYASTCFYFASVITIYTHLKLKYEQNNLSCSNTFLVTGPIGKKLKIIQLYIHSESARNKEIIVTEHTQDSAPLQGRQHEFGPLQGQDLQKQ
uniref:Uncharacterized protein n=1 Tax=Glossina pallidipes TaxID=7398 RepID=A0A1A9ZB09_GLOPL